MRSENNSQNCIDEAKQTINNCLEECNLNDRVEIGRPFSVPYYFSALWSIADAYYYGKAYGITPEKETDRETAENKIMEELQKMEELQSSDAMTPFTKYVDKIFKGYYPGNNIDPKNYPRLTGPENVFYSPIEKNGPGESERYSEIFNIKLEACICYLSGLELTRLNRAEVINRVFSKIPKDLKRSAGYGYELDFALNSFFNTDTIRLPDDFGSDLFLNTEKQKKLDEYVRSFNASADVIVGDVRSGRIYDADHWWRYLEKYYDLCRYMLSNEAGILHRDEFHSGKTLDSIQKIGLIELKKRYPDFFELTEKENSDIYYTSMYSPMTLMAFNRFFDNMELFSAKWKKCSDESELFAYEIQKSSVLCQFERTLRRRIVIKRDGSFYGETFLILPNRYYSALQCVSNDSLSSNESVRIVRLFEKIVSSITRLLKNSEKNQNELLFIISIFNYVERGLEPNYVSNKDINLLANELNIWYKHMTARRENFPDMKFVIQLFTNQSKLFPDNFIQGDFTFDYEYCPGCSNGNITVLINRIYTANKAADTPLKVAGKWGWNREAPEASFLKEIIRESNVTFFISCPWLSKEDFQVRNNGSLESFSNKLKYTELADDYFYNALDRDIMAESVLNRIEEQFGRIMLGEDIKFGYTTRVPRDYLLDWFRSILTDQSAPRDLYVYYPINEGLECSKYNDWIYSRPEQYSDKNLKILRFSNIDPRDNSPRFLKPCGGEIHPLNIRLWSLLKASNILTAYVQFAAEFKERLSGSGLSIHPENLVSLYRNIIISLSFSAGGRRISVAINKSQVFDDVLKQMISEDSIERAEQKINELLLFVRKVIVQIMKEPIFYDDLYFGSREIMDAFETTVYSAASCVDHILFLHNYQEARKNKELCFFRIEEDKNDIGLSDVSYENDPFADKSVLLTLCRAFDKKQTAEPIVYRALSNVSEYGDSKGEVLRRLQTACLNALGLNQRMIMNIDQYIYEYF